MVKKVQSICKVGCFPEWPWPQDTYRRVVLERRHGAGFCSPFLSTDTSSWYLEQIIKALFCCPCPGLSSEQRKLSSRLPSLAHPYLLNGSSFLEREATKYAESSVARVKVHSFFWYWTRIKEAWKQRPPNKIISLISWQRCPLVKKSLICKP